MEKALASRVIHFTSKGGGYSGIWMGSKGDIYQEYETVNGTTKYYPAISSSSPITMALSITSARTAGLVTPASCTYYANGTKLTFSGLNCTNAGWQSVFALTADGNLKIIGNLGAVMMGSFILEAEAVISQTNGSSDTIHVSAPVTLVPYNGADYARTTIISPDSKNFTITDKGGSCQLKALTTKGGVEVTAGLSYKWYRIVAGVFTVISGATSQTLTVQEADVDTYGMYKLEVLENNAVIASDTQQVLDASDPYDIIISSHYNPGTNGAADVSTNDLELNDEMPDTAYLLFTCSFVKRGQTAAVSGGTYSFSLMSGNGATVQNLAALSGAANKCKVTVATLRQWGIGDYTIIVEGTI